MHPKDAIGRYGEQLAAHHLHRTGLTLLARNWRCAAGEVDIVAQFSYVVETERRFYLTNDVDLQPRTSDGEVYFELTMRDAWVWDMYRPARFVKTVRVLTFKDVNIEELEKPDLELPDKDGFGT